MSHRSKTIVVLFEEQVKKTPDYLAIVAGEHRITYAVLNRKVNQVAHYLRSLGVKHEAIVALHLDRSPEAIIAMLAVLKVGGAYLPLNIEDNADQLQWKLRQSDATFLIAPAIKMLPKIDLSNLRQVLGLDEVLHENFPEENLNLDIASSDLAYLMYKGDKGVEIEHKGVPNLARSQREIFGLLPRDRMLHLSPLHRDASVAEIFTALLNGAVLCLPPKPSSLDPVDLAYYLWQHHVSIAMLPAAIVERMPRRDLSLKSLIITDGFCSKGVKDYWSKHCRVISAYGSTETTVYSALSVYEGLDTPHIGNVIANTQCYVLDEHQKPVSSGEVGHLYIGGIGLARGYRNYPELTKQVFIEYCPQAAPEFRQRLYRTGKRVKYCADGKLEEFESF